MMENAHAKEAHRDLFQVLKWGHTASCKFFRIIYGGNLWLTPAEAAEAVHHGLAFTVPRPYLDPQICHTLLHHVTPSKFWWVLTSYCTIWNWCWLWPRNPMVLAVSWAHQGNGLCGIFAPRYIYLNTSCSRVELVRRGVNCNIESWYITLLIWVFNMFKWCTLAFGAIFLNPLLHWGSKCSTNFNYTLVTFWTQIVQNLAVLKTYIMLKATIGHALCKRHLKNYKQDQYIIYT